MLSTVVSNQPQQYGIRGVTIGHYTLVLYTTVQYITVQYNTIQYSTLQYITVQYNRVEYSVFLDSNKTSDSLTSGPYLSGLSPAVT